MLVSCCMALAWASKSWHWPSLVLTSLKVFWFLYSVLRTSYSVHYSSIETKERRITKWAVCMSILNIACSSWRATNSPPRFLLLSSFLACLLLLLHWESSSADLDLIAPCSCICLGLWLFMLPRSTLFLSFHPFITPIFFSLSLAQSALWAVTDWAARCLAPKLGIVARSVGKEGVCEAPFETLVWGHAWFVTRRCSSYTIDVEINILSKISDKEMERKVRSRSYALDIVYS